MQIVKECFNLVSKRPDTVCNFLESGRCVQWSKKEGASIHLAFFYSSPFSLPFPLSNPPSPLQAFLAGRMDGSSTGIMQRCTLSLP